MNKTMLLSWYIFCYVKTQNSLICNLASDFANKVSGKCDVLNYDSTLTVVLKILVLQ